MAQTSAAAPAQGKPKKQKRSQFSGMSKALIRRETISAYCFLLPSLFEGLPVVLVEAQTAGLPCFVSDTIDRGAAFTDRVRFLPLKDPDAWANAIGAASFRRDPNARRKAVDAGYDIHTSAGVLQEFYLRRYAEVMG